MKAFALLLLEDQSVFLDALINSRYVARTWHDKNRSTGKMTHDLHTTRKRIAAATGVATVTALHFTPYEHLHDNLEQNVNKSK